MDRGSNGDSRLTRSASVAESASVRTVRSRWKPNENKKKILHSIFMSGVRNPPVDQVHRIAEELRRHGAVEGKNVYYWFHNVARKEKLQKQRSAPSSKRVSTFKLQNWTSLFRSKAASDKTSAQGEELFAMQKESVDSGVRRNLSVDLSEIRTLEIFPQNTEEADFHFRNNDFAFF